MLFLHGFFGRCTKEFIHCDAESDALRLRYVELNPNQADYTKARVHNVGRPADTSNEVRGDASNDNLEDPLNTGSDGTASCLDVSGKDLAADIPRKRTERYAKSKGKDVDHKDRNDPVWIELSGSAL